MHASIILLGPYQAGKSTLRRLLAERLAMPQCSLHPFEDEKLLLRYFHASGYDEAREGEIVEMEGVAGLYRYLKPFEAYAVERCLAEHPGHIVELGPTLGVYEDSQLLRRVQHALSPYPDVILLMPSPDREEAYHVLRERYWALIDIDRNEHFVKHPSNQLLAKYTVYTEGKTPEETRDEVLQIIAADGAPTAPIMLIGPPAAGKSTTAGLLGSRLQLPHVGLDVVGWEYARAAGWDEAVAHNIFERDGEQAVRRYEESVWATVVERILAEQPNAIIDFGAGHSVYEEPDLFARVQRAIAPHRHVILLLPSPDPDESVRILKERPRSTIEGVDANKYIIDHPSMYALAKHVVYTGGKTPEATCDEILQRIHIPKS